MGFLPAGYPYNQTTLGGGTANTSSALTPQQSAEQYLAYIEAISNSPLGQQAQSAQQQTIAMQVKQALAAMQAERDRIAIAQGQAAANEWYQKQQVQLAQQAHQLAVQTQQQNYGLAVGGLTGMFNGQPTLAAQNQQQQYALQQAQLALSQLTQQQQHELAQGTLNLATLTQQQQNAIQQAQLGLTQAGITGEFNGQPTLAALAQQQNFGLAQAGITGLYNGSPTLAGQNQAFQQGVQAADLTGLYNGAPTLAAQNQQFNQGLALGAQTGYQGGQATLAREQAAANVALQAGQLGASLRGPGDWAQYLQAANGVAGSPASSLVSSVPGGLGASAGPGPGPMTLAKLLGDYGVMPSQGTAQPGQPASGLSPAEQSRYDQITARRAQLQAAGEGDVSAADLAELASYQARGARQTVQPLNPQEQARYDQIVARQAQQRAAGEAPDPNDSAELARYQARGARSSMPFQGVGGAGHGAGPIDQYGNPIGGGAAMYAGGTPNFNEATGSYSSAPAGGLRPSVQPVQNWAPDAGSGYTTRGSVSVGEITPQRIGYVDQQAQQGWNPYSLTGALGQATQAPTVTNAQLGLSDAEAGQLQNYFANPNQAPTGWWESKSKDQRSYLNGLNQFWGGSPDTFQDRYANSRPRQGAWNAAA